MPSKTRHHATPARVAVATALRHAPWDAAFHAVVTMATRVAWRVRASTATCPGATRSETSIGVKPSSRNRGTPAP